MDHFKSTAGDSRLIANLNGNKAMRKSTIRDLKKLNQISDEINYVDAISSTRKNFITIDLGESDILASSQILEDWLNSDKFNYFEIDTQVNMI